MNEGEVSSGELFEACEDAAIVLHVAEHDLDLVTFFVESPVGFALDRSYGMRRDDGLGFFGPDGFEDGVTIIGAISEHGLGIDPVDQGERSWRIAGLACAQIEAQRIAEGVTGSMNLAGKAATRAAKSLISFVFFAPAAQA